MKYIAKTFFLTLILTLIACQTNKIDVAESRMSIPEPDKPLRIESQLKASLSKIPLEISSSDSIELCNNGLKLINSGEEIIPYLKEQFLDSTETLVFSQSNNRNLTIGEIAIIIASEIKPIPIARVVGIQQCTPPFDMDIENYFSRINEYPQAFIKNYNDWIKKQK